MDNPPKVLTVRQQLTAVRTEIDTLKASVNAWKDAWFQLRDIIGRLSWEHHHCPHEIKPQIKQIEVRVNGKLVAAVNSPESEAAVLRLMSLANGEKK